MSYTIRDRNERLGDKRRSRLAIVAISFCIIVGLGLFLRHSIQIFYTNLRGGTGALVETVGTEAALALRSKRSIATENAALHAALVEAQAREAYVLVLENENASLHTLLSYHVDKPAPQIARVVGKPSENLYNRIILDQGADSGIAVGDHAGIYSTMLLGTVLSVSDRTSVVDLYSSPSAVLNGVLLRESITIPVRGNGGGNFEIQVPRDIKVEDGDIITLAERPDMVIAIVKSVVFDPRDPFQTVLARTPVNIQELKYVEIMK